ncbi:MAG: hypothetical protein N2578_01925 [Bdellovibrionaceae bacterium]|nr:hypothetical protein [Pseudobdellovibrionaceae bacterium]
MVQFIFIFLISIITQICFAAEKDLLFEGYSKLLSESKSGSKHIGYSINRYSFDSRKRLFSAIQFTRINTGTESIIESLTATADENLNPVSYTHTSMLNKKIRVIDATFKAGKMTAKVRENNKLVRTIHRDIPTGTFLSSFLVYLMLKSKHGLLPEAKYEYTAIAEEDAALEKGVAIVGKEEWTKSVRTYRITNKFKNTDWISYVSERGEILSTESPSVGIKTELVAQPAEATGSFPLHSEIIKTLFGEIPSGRRNILSEMAELETEKSKIAPGKQQGVPQGMGIQIKGQPSGTEGQ